MKPTKAQIQNMTKDEIVESFQVSEKTAIRWMKCHGLFKKQDPKIGIESARLIRSRFSKGDQIKDLAKEYKVTLSSIYRIVNNETYTETKDDAQVSVVYKPK